MDVLDLDWTTLYMEDRLSSSWYRPRAGSGDRIPIPAACEADWTRFRQALLKRDTLSPFRTEWGPQQERLRIKPVVTFDVDRLFICKRYRAKSLSLYELGFPTSLVRWMLDEPGEPGLYLFMGPQEVGKTTAAAAYVVESVAAHGGSAFTVEVPIEIRIEGDHGKGHVYQTELEDEAQMGAQFRGLLRSGALMLHAGEITLDVSAREVVSIAGAGNRMTTTFHSNDLLGGLRRFADCAGGNYNSLAEILQAVFFLNLRPVQSGMPSTSNTSLLPGARPFMDQHFTVSPLLMTRESRTIIKSALRSERPENLLGEINRQRDLLMSGKVPR